MRECMSDRCHHPDKKSKGDRTAEGQERHVHENGPGTLRTDRIAHVHGESRPGKEDIRIIPPNELIAVQINIFCPLIMDIFVCY